MALVDPYATCPCGSGQKFKWCCHKVEAHAERAQRLYESGQVESALQAIDEGLRKEPGNAWLLSRKAIYLTRSGQPDPAKAAVRSVLDQNPRHVGAQMLMTRLVLETEGASAGAAQLQQALTAVPPEARKALAGLVKVVGAFLSESEEVPAALRHLRLALTLDESDQPDSNVVSAVRTLEGNPGVSPWLKNPDALSAPPEALSGEARARFTEAIGWAGEGLWSSAASAFETLSADAVAGPPADRNLGFCRLWLADNAAAVVALRRYARRLGNTAEAVDVEALCQQISTPAEDSDGLVEHVQLIWPVRDRNALINALNADNTIHAEEPAPIDPEDPNAAEVDQFTMLDRPEIEHATSGLTIDDLPRIESRLFVGADTVALETFDDGRLDRLSARFTSLARSGIAPAHPKTKVVGKVPRIHLALVWEWLLPEGVEPEHARKLSRDQGVRLIDKVWPETPNPAFGGRTPLQAAKAGDAEVPLRAAVMQFERGRESWREGFDFAALRSRLNVPAEPAIDPETVDVAALHLSRLALVPADRLPDEALFTLYRRARAAAIEDAIWNSAKALTERPERLEGLGVPTLAVYTDLASIANAHDRTEEAFDWVRRGRQADAPATRARNAPSWDMFELRLRARAEDPSVWVPDLAVILDRYSDDQRASQSLMMNLIDMGLLEMVPNPDRSGEVMIDSRPLQALMSEFGPRVTTSTGRLGVSATKPEIWTPGTPSTGGGGVGVWTPGSAPPREGPSGGGPKLIIPGR